jgi:hypothetical protein
MVKEITFYDKTEAIQYQLHMRRLGYVTKMIHPENMYEVSVAGEAPEWKNPTGVENVSDALKNDI